MGGRLEGWMHGTDSLPSFETRRKDAALLRMRLLMFHRLVGWARRLCPPYSSIQMKLAELAMLGPDPAHRASDRPHHDCLGLDQSFAKSHTPEHRPGGDAGGGEKAIACHHVFHLVFL